MWGRLQVNVLSIFTKSGFGVGCKSMFSPFSQRLEWGRLQVSVLPVFTETGVG